MLYIILALLALGILILVHEFGHFILAKLNGVNVQEFSIGMGPKLFSFQKKETMYSLRLFPIGGYVMMLGEGEDVEDKNSYSSKSPLRRLSITVAGVIMNYIFAILIFTVVTHAHGYISTTIQEVQPSSLAYNAGMLPDDEIINVNGFNIYTFSDITTSIKLSNQDDISITVKRNGQNKQFTIIPTNNDLGIKVYGSENPGIIDSLHGGINETKSLIYETYYELKLMFTGKVNFKTDIGGPVTIIKTSSHAAQLGILPFLYFVGFLSVNLAVMNLLPFPALDGGVSVLLLIEIISRKKIPMKIVQIINIVGFSILMIFMVIVTIKDIIFPVNF